MSRAVYEQFRVQVKQEILQKLDCGLDFSDGQVRRLIDERLCRSDCIGRLDVVERRKLGRELFAAIRGFDVLQELLEDKRITEIMVNGPDRIFIERDGRLTQWQGRFESPARLLDVIQQIAAGCNRVVNEASPILDARLSDGSRVNVVLSPVALNGPAMTIRRFPEEGMTLDRLVALGSITEECKSFLELLVKCRYNIFISGGTGSGKTTFLNALSQAIPPEERIVTIEDSAELQLKYAQNLVSLETRNANMEGCRTISVRDLIRSSLRMRPDSLMMKKRKSKHNKKGLTIPRSLADDALGDLVLLLHRKIIKVGQKCLDLGALIFCVFQGCRVPSFFLGELRLFPFQLLKLDVQLLDLGHDILRGGGLCRRGQCAGEAVDLLLCLFYIFS